MSVRCLFILCFFLLAAGSGYGQFGKKSRSKKPAYPEISFEDLMRRYFDKEIDPFTALEGIYSVSCVVTKTGKNILLGTDTERVVDRKDNYARVAILKDRRGANRDYIEISMSYREPDKYPVIGELHVLSEGRGLIYRHTEPDGSVLSFSMTNQTDLIEGEYTIVKGNKTITYRLSYLRIYPKAADISLGGY